MDPGLRRARLSDRSWPHESRSNRKIHSAQRLLDTASRVVRWLIDRRYWRLPESISFVTRVFSSMSINTYIHSEYAYKKIKTNTP